MSAPDTSPRAPSLSIRDASLALQNLTDQLPMPVAQCVDDYCRTGRNDALFFAVESALRFLATIVKSAYLSEICPPSAAFNNLIRQWLLRPSMGSWWNFLSNARPLIGSGEVPSPFPELHAVLESLASWDVLRVVTLRNDAYGHVGSSPTPEMDAAVATELVPLAARLLGELEVLRRYPLLVFDEQAGHWLRCMGPKPSPETRAPTSPAAAATALLSIEEGHLALFPLVLGSFDGYQPTVKSGARETMLVFDGVDLDRKHLVYVGRHGRGHGKRWFDEYRSRLRARRVSILPVKAEDLPGPALLQRVGQAFVEAYVRAGLMGDIHADIDDLDRSVEGLIDDAIASQARLAVVTGDAGTGKSTHLYAAGQRWTDRGHIVLHVHASAFDGTRSFRDALRAALEAQLGLLGSADRVLALAQDALVITQGENARIALLLDGLDETGAPSRVRLLLGEIRDWVLGQVETLPSLRVLIAVRSAHLEAVQRLGDPLQKVTHLLYRPTRRGTSGHDDVAQAIWLMPAAKGAAEVGQRYERYRLRSPAHRPLTPFSALAPGVQDACNNPRWMVQLLDAFNGREVPALQSSFDLWDGLLQRWVYALTGLPNGPQRPLFPGRVKLVEALVRAQLQAGGTGVLLRTLENDPDAAPLVCRDGHRDELTSLQSLGVVLVEGSDPHDPFADVIVRPMDDGMAAALFANSRIFTASDVTFWAKLVAAHESRPLWTSLADALVVSLARRAAHAGWSTIQPALVEVDEVLEAQVWLRTLATTPTVATHAVDGLLNATQDERREAVLRALLRLAWSSGQQRSLEGLAEALAAAEPSKHSSASVELVASIFRHAERVDDAEPWLNNLAERRIDLHGGALFQLAELLRDKGQWRKAARYYALVAATDPDPTRAAHALAGQGECEIWLQEVEPALRHLHEALSRMGEHTTPDVRCNVHLKRGIAARLARRYPMAMSELLTAERLALRHHFRTEQAKVALEMGLVASALGQHDEALELIGQALGNRPRSDVA